MITQVPKGVAPAANTRQKSSDKFTKLQNKVNAPRSVVAASL